MNAWWIIVAAAGLLAIPVAAVCYIAWNSFTPPRDPGVVPDAIDPSRLEEIEFPSGGRTVRGSIYRPVGETRGIVILVHGWGSSANNLLRWSVFLAEGGWASLAFDLRGHGRSDGGDPMPLPRLAEDVESAAAFLDARADLRAMPRALLGHSIGGAAVLLALSRGMPAQAAVISSAFARVEAASDYVLRKWLLPPVLFRRLVKLVWSLRLGRGMNAFEPERTVGRVNVPLLLTHGSEDPTIPLREVRRLGASADPARTQVLLVPGAAHSDLPEFPVYREKVLAFLEEQRIERPMPID